MLSLFTLNLAPSIQRGDTVDRPHRPRQRVAHLLRARDGGGAAGAHLAGHIQPRREVDPRRGETLPHVHHIIR